MEIDFSKYNNIEEIIEDIKSVKIQGATNVAIACFEGLKLFIKNFDDKSVSVPLFIAEVEKAGIRLANARLNEPLAKNGVKFVMNMLHIQNPGLKDIDMVRVNLVKLTEEYLNFIKQAKQKVVENAESILTPELGSILTHCHSSTAEKIIIHQNEVNPNLEVICTETRPLFQGRITATELVKAGVSTTLIADSAVESFIIGRGNVDPEIIFIGCDEITMAGEAINKIGSWGVAHSAYYASKPVYVVTSILKVDVTTLYRPLNIEMREAREIWPEAPKDLKMVNPSFDRVNKEFITGFITEVGILKPDEIAKAIQKEYQWLF